ncbi:MAG: tryptophan--tRNA ligase [Deltaproteobacteria bacterium]|nr:tryptophan--tRNA ligase [Deltaproteobacteria bacterium]
MQHYLSRASEKPIVLTGDRPTGPLHLGHYVGSLRSRLSLQENYQQFVLIADLQALTDNAENPGKVTGNVLEVALDYLAVGIDPAQTTICIQSQMPELAELSMYLLNLVTVAQLERNPTVKDEIRQRGFRRNIPAGFLTYPVSQAADITAFKARYVPVGEDQLPMIEQTNELVRKFNRSYGDVLPEVEAILSRVSRLPGVDGKTKMSKSLGNAIPLCAEPDEIHRAVERMYTDSGHLRVSDPGKVEGNVVFMYLDAFEENTALVDELKAHYRRGGLGDGTLKQMLEVRLQEMLAPIRERRHQLAHDPGQVMDILREGSEVARQVAARTLAEVRHALGLEYFCR